MASIAAPALDPSWLLGTSNSIPNISAATQRKSHTLTYAKQQIFPCHISTQANKRTTCHRIVMRAALTHKIW